MKGACYTAPFILFLEVAMARWLIKKRINNIEEICNNLGVHKPLAYSLTLKGIKTAEDAREYIYSGDKQFRNITLFKNIKKAYDVLSDYIDNGKPVCIYGDYDADGVLSTTILCKALSFLGANVTYFIPDRVEDGYGLSSSSVINIAKRGIKLIITCDNGIASSEQIDIANKLDIDVIVLDHHEPKFDDDGIEIVPNAVAVIDAKLKDSGYPFREMCAGGLCYRFVKGFFEYLGKDFSVLDDELVTFAGIATVCDVVSLIDENRIFVQKAIKNINSSITNLGLRALLDIKNISEISTYHIGFVIGPCINASGRLDSAAHAVDLFLTNDYKEAYEKALFLSNINEERKALTEYAVEEVENNIGENPDDKIIVVYNKNIHESIAGIIAGRVREKYNRPTIVLTDSMDKLKGSARSIEQYDIFKGLYAQKDLLLTFGGHTMAAGLSLAKENLDLFKKSINDDCTLTEKDFVDIIRIDGQISLEDITEESVDEISSLAPFGKGNEQPYYGLINVQAVSIKFIGKNKNFVRTVLRDKKGYEVVAIDFNNYDKWVDIISDEGYTVETSAMARPFIDLVFYLDINEFNGVRNPQIKIKDLRKSKNSEKKC